MKVLVVDTDELSSRILAKKLENWGHTAVVARNTFEAERLLERENFRLIVTEIDLPGRSGTELVRVVRAASRPRYTYIMILTGVSDSNRLLDALESGADDLLRKPLNVFEMRLRIKGAKRMLNMEDELREGAGTDGTTGLVNLQSFRQFFRVIVAENRRTKATGALMYVHIDNYLDVRESSGYQSAELMMRTVARGLGELVRNADLVARVSDTTFCLCLQNTDWPTCKIVGDKIQARVRATELVVEGHDLRPRISIESVNFPDEDSTPDELLTHAPRYPFAGGDPVPPAPPDPREEPTGDYSGEPEAPPVPTAELDPETTDTLRRAGIDPVSYQRLSEFERSRVLKLAEQLAGAAFETQSDPS